MDIAGLSVAMNQMNVKQQAQFSVMKKVMDTNSVRAGDMLQMLDAAPTAPDAIDPNLGRNLDLKV